LKIATWNVNGIRARYEQLLQWIKEEAPAIVCLQELKAGRAQIPPALLELPGYWSYWHGGQAYSGVALQIHKDLISEEPAFAHPFFDYENRVVTVEIRNLVFASIYVPNGGKDFAAKLKFLKDLESYVAEVHARGQQLILGGDINVTRTERDVHPKERKPKAIGQRPEERELLEHVLECGLVDIGRTLDPDNDQLFTWWAPWRAMRQRNIGWRIDYLFASVPLAERFSSCKVLPQVGTSDHAPVLAEAALL
jgi:exodeoxyribonuclease-3